MQSGVDPVTEAELAAYVDGQLDEWQLARVEAHLAHHPQAAARVMQDLHLERELRLSLGLMGQGAPARQQTSRQAARRLERGLSRDALLRRTLPFGPFAVMAVFGALVWAGYVPLGARAVSASAGPPEFVAAALDARKASDIRFPMRSMIEDPELDAEELRAMTGILLPEFDPDWAVLDAQVFPSPQGPGIEVVFETPDIGRVTHFAVRPGDFTITPPEMTVSGDSPVVWFQIGETAHVMIAGKGDAADLEAAALRLAGALYP